MTSVQAGLMQDKGIEENELKRAKDLEGFSGIPFTDRYILDERDTLIGRINLKTDTDRKTKIDICLVVFIL